MPTALISVSNKDKIAEFARHLAGLGYDIISTGGTYKLLAEAGIKNLKKVEEITGFPEIMDGRVKTLHPSVFGGILADRSKKSHLKEAADNQIPLIDLVVCNLYPFNEQPSIKNIDIGGVSLLRAAAKNYESVMAVVDPADYQKVLSSENTLELRKELAHKAFSHTAAYDAMIADYFGAGQNLSLNFRKLYDLRYGENPHQAAAFYTELSAKEGIGQAEILHGKELSYNNIVDTDAALNLIREFSEPAVAVIKHTNPCGCAKANNITEAFRKAYRADALAAFGGVIVLNRLCNQEIASEINQVFVEMVIAPDYDQEALSVLKRKKNLRIIKTGEIKTLGCLKDYKKVVGGILEQDYDNSQLKKADLKAVTKIKPTAGQIEELLFAWQVVRHVKSNAIVLAKGGVTVGIGAGQMSRVDAVDLAVKKGGSNLAGGAAASDAFFPFPDSIDKLAESGIKSIIQPGGSIKDAEVIEAANKYGLAMVFTSTRAFKH